MGIPVQNTDREGTAAGRFIDIFREKAALLSFMTAFTDETQALEDALFQIFEGFNINTAEGAQLDGIGEIVGVDREGTTDDVYRIRIRARILLNTISGTPNQILRLVNLLLPGAQTSHYQPYYPASFVVEISGALDDESAEEIGQAVLDAAPAGVGSALLYSIVDDSDTFIFADSTALQNSDTQGFASLPIANTWTARTSGHANTINALAYGDGNFVCGEDGSNAIAYSTDGTTWNLASIGSWSSRVVSSIAFGASTFVAVSSVTLPARFSYSTDGGATWASADAIGSFGNVECTKVVFQNSLFLVLGTGGNLATSADGTSFTSQGAGVIDETVYDCAFGNSLYVVVGENGAIYTSPDGSTWTERTSGTTEHLKAVAFGGGKFVAVGENGTVLSSADGITWATEAGGFGTSNVNAVVYNLGHFVAGGDDGKLAWSTNADTWTQVTSGFSTDAIRAFGISSEAIIAVGDNAKLSVSEDGEEWTAKDSTFTASAIAAAVEGEDLFVIAGESGKLATSESTQVGGRFAGVVSNT